MSCPIKSGTARRLGIDQPEPPAAPMTTGQTFAAFQQAMQKWVVSVQEMQQRAAAGLPIRPPMQITLLGSHVPEDPDDTSH